MSYRLLSYVSKGQPRAGLLVNEAVYDLAAATRNAAWSSVLAVLNDWPKAKAALAKAAKATRAKGLPLAKTKLLAPILRSEERRVGKESRTMGGGPTSKIKIAESQ